jgi:hypothetical protein
MATQTYKTLKSIPDYFGIWRFVHVGLRSRFRLYHIEEALALNKFSIALLMLSVNLAAENSMVERLFSAPNLDLFNNPPANPNSKQRIGGNNDGDVNEHHPWLIPFIRLLREQSSDETRFKSVFESLVPEALKWQIMGSRQCLVWNVLAASRVKLWKIVEKAKDESPAGEEEVGIRPSDVAFLGRNPPNQDDLRFVKLENDYLFDEDIAALSLESSVLRSSHHGVGFGRDVKMAWTQLRSKSSLDDDTSSLGLHNILLPLYHKNIPGMQDVWNALGFTRSGTTIPSMSPPQYYLMDRTDTAKPVSPTVPLRQIAIKPRYSVRLLPESACLNSDGAEEHRFATDVEAARQALPKSKHKIRHSSTLLCSEGLSLKDRIGRGRDFLKPADHGKGSYSILLDLTIPATSFVSNVFHEVAHVQASESMRSKVQTPALMVDDADPSSVEYQNVLKRRPYEADPGVYDAGNIMAFSVRGMTLHEAVKRNIVSDDTSKGRSIDKVVAADDADESL